MLLECIATKGSDLGPYKWGGYYFPETQFELTLGKLYQAYAMMLINGGLEILTADDYGKPFWYPIQAFTVKDPSMPEGWLFRFFPEVEPGGMPGEHRAQAIWGYREMACSDQHNEMLMEREPDALAVFNAQRAGQ